MLMICDSVNSACENCKHGVPHKFTHQCGPDHCSVPEYYTKCVPARLKDYTLPQLAELNKEVATEFAKRMDI